MHGNRRLASHRGFASARLKTHYSVRGREQLCRHVPAQGQDQRASWTGHARPSRAAGVPVVDDGRAPTAHARARSPGNPLTLKLRAPPRPEAPRAGRAMGEALAARRSPPLRRPRCPGGPPPRRRAPAARHSRHPLPGPRLPLCRLLLSWGPARRSASSLRCRCGGSAPKCAPGLGDVPVGLARASPAQPRDERSLTPLSELASSDMLIRFSRVYAAAVMPRR